MRGNKKNMHGDMETLREPCFMRFVFDMMMLGAVWFSSFFIQDAELAHIR